MRRLDKPSPAFLARVNERYDRLGQELFNRLRRPLMDDERERLKARAEREIREADEAAFRAKEDALRALLKTPERNTALAAHLELLANEHQTMLLLDPKPHASALAFRDERKTVLPMTFGDRNYAAGVHEQGHLLAEPCEGGWHHHDYGKVACLECERIAWLIGMSLAIEWSETMHEEMCRCISTYTDGTRGPSPAFRAIDELKSRLTFCRERQRRLNEALAREQATRAS
jgi:hypothetical protein